MAEKETAIEEPKKASKRRSRFSLFVVIYLIIGLFFAIFFAKFYHWPPFGFFSPGFYFVILTWPFQLFHGFLGDFFYYGIQGPPI